MKKYRWIMNIVVLVMVAIGFLLLNTSSDKPVAKPSAATPAAPNPFKR